EIREPTGLRRDEDDLAAIGGESSLIFVVLVGGKALDAAAIGLHAKDVSRALALGGEGDPIALWRPRGTVVERPWLSKCPLAGAIGISNIKRGLTRRNAAKDNTIGSSDGKRSSYRYKGAKKETTHSSLQKGN